MTPFLLLSVALAAPPSADGPTRIEVYPEKVVLRTKRARVQLVVTGHYPNGEARDLTSEAVFTPSADAVEVRDGVVFPKQDGAAADVMVAAAGLTTRVSVDVTGQNKPDPIRFRSEVQAVLTKQGCNSGSCHGSPQGKGGFSLSLFGYDPAFDGEALVRGGLNRRVDLTQPSDSLLLKKPLMRLPHVGGKKLAPTDAAYPILLGWIKNGAKLDDAAAPACTGITIYPGPARVLKSPHTTQQLSVLATFADNSVRDVTALATYETSHKDVVSADERGRVTGMKRGQGAVSVRYLEHMQSVHFTVVEDVPGFRWPDPPTVNLVDQLVHIKLKQLQVPPSDLCNDSTFLRRIHLDLTGQLPSAETARAFLADKSARKRAKMIDALLASDEFALSWAQRSADLMRVTTKGLPGGRAEKLAEFLADSYRENTPFDKLVFALLTASGDGADVPAANYFLAVPTPEDLTETTAQLFLGSRINCAKCHNHPYENWTQEDYYRISAVFARVKKAGGQVMLANAGEMKHPVSGKVMTPFAAASLRPDPDPKSDRRVAFAKWLTARGNPLFARVEVNRIWAALLGRGIVHPVDDFRSSNPATNPELLDGLAAEFEKSAFDRKHMIRLVCNSHVYQRSSAVNPLNADDDALFSHARIRRLTAEQLQDAVGLVAGSLRPACDASAEVAKKRAEIAARAAELRADQSAWEEKMRKNVAVLPGWAGVWHAVGPFPKPDDGTGHATAFPPEEGFDPTRTYDPGELAWVKHSDWLDGQPLDIGSRAGTFYLTRAVFAREAGTAEVVLDRRRYEFKLWMDGRLVFDSARDNKLAAGQMWRIPLPVSAGWHRMLLKITRQGGNNPNMRNTPFPITFTLPGGKALPPGLTPEITELLAVPPLDLTPEQTATLNAARAGADPKMRELREQARQISTRSVYAALRPVPEGTEFLRAFGQPVRESPCACERTEDTTVDQALQLLNGKLVAERVVASPSRYSNLTDDRLTKELYLAAFARFPTAEEQTKVAAHLKAVPDRAEAVRDVVWALLNTREFLLQH